MLSRRDKNTVENCYAGTDVSGVNARPNGTGILVSSDDNVIGGVTDAARNVISGNTGDGIKIMSGKQNRVMGNFIGTDSDGVQPLANRAGIRLANRDSTRIGGIVPGAGNVISGNTAAGIVATADDGEVTTRVEGNRIGTTTSGMGAAANGEGILIENLGGFLIN